MSVQFAPHSRKKILIVADEGAVRDSLAVLLTEMQYCVEATDDTAETVRLFAWQPPDLLLVDLEMANSEADDIIQLARRTLRSIPIVAMAQDRRKGYDAMWNAVSLGATGAVYASDGAARLVETVDR